MLRRQKKGQYDNWTTSFVQSQDILQVIKLKKTNKG